MSGCLDAEESGDTGKGGIFTHALLLAVDNLTQQDEEDYSVSKAYNMTLKYDDEIFNSRQTITLNMTEKARERSMLWPMQPQYEYSAPLRRARHRKRALNDDPASSQAELEQLGVKPGPMTTLANGDQNLDIDLSTLPKERRAPCEVKCCIQ